MIKTLSLVAFNPFTKILVFCFLVILCQIALVKPIGDLNINLAFSSIIALASLTGFFETVLASLIFITLIANFSYHSEILWIYTIIAFLAVKFNPSNIADKFLVCLAATVIFTPLVELFNPSNLAFSDKLISASLANLISSALMFFIVKFFFNSNKKKYSY